MFWTSFLMSLRFHSVTLTGTVSSSAICFGTPTWFMLRAASGLITVRAEKLTRFPDRLYRKRPSLPLSLWKSVFRDLPERCRAGGIPETSLLK